MTEEQIDIIRAIQEGITLSEEPFAEAAKKAGDSAERLIEQIRIWLEFGAAVRHLRAGFTTNAMAVWDVPDDRIETFAEAATSYKEISHCYQRPRFEGFPYNIYTMIHGKTREDCEATARKIAAKTGIQNHKMLYTTVEFKKSSPIYFISGKDRGSDG